ncbi:undecaprenyl-phosphate glucose phosphotransferase [Amorphus orientalis]|uniref:Undecaprenyl-phosphate glucose phosphotransferase n=1 Tax=Amorphus orientalis TaxID=649198 RepID=A0AAE3VQN6_9HYPH|nr:undecaprenyl-phosphate glucose phosphotransferase [Amorphus orientalis]MDQ0316592.1 Undecaprenyl-phosphate glucose phosphotransferase [Amorphus orientalis]
MVRSPLRLQQISELQQVGDLLLLMVLGLAAYIIYPGLAVEQAQEYLLAAALGSLVCISVLRLNKGYSEQPYLIQGIKVLQITVALLLTGAVLATIAFAFKESETYSRLWAAIWLALAWIGLVSSRVAVASILTRVMRRGALVRRTAIYGGGDQGKQLLAHIADKQDPSVQIVGYYDEREEEERLVVAGLQRLGGLQELQEAVAAGKVDTIILALPFNAEARLTQISAMFDSYPVTILLAPDLIMWRVMRGATFTVAGVPLPRLADAPIVGWAGVIKLFEDKVLSSLLLLLLAPIMVLIAIAVRLDTGGPILFRQPRRGFNGELFTIYKFRTMHAAMADPEGARQATRNDRRVTRVGWFLRRMSLDELPQFWNVLKGDMSLVGPRPHAPGTKVGDESFERAVARYSHRYRVKPGITGWAQVNGWRGETDSPEKLQMRVRYDVEYIDNWSLGLDLYILAITPFAVLFRRSRAY